TTSPPPSPAKSCARSAHAYPTSPTSTTNSSNASYPTSPGSCPAPSTSPTPSPTNSSAASHSSEEGYDVRAAERHSHHLRGHRLPGVGLPARRPLRPQSQHLPRPPREPPRRAGIRAQSTEPEPRHR